MIFAQQIDNGAAANKQRGINRKDMAMPDVELGRDGNCAVNECKCP